MAIDINTLCQFSSGSKRVSLTNLTMNGSTTGTVETGLAVVEYSDLVPVSAESDANPDIATLTYNNNTTTTNVGWASAGSGSPGDVHITEATDGDTYVLRAVGW